MKLPCLLVFLVLVGCATNRLHFAPYTPDADLLAIEIQKTHTAITDVTGIERCSTCSEMSKIVWHAANYNGGLYEGFANIPVANWPEFIRQAIGSDAAASMKTRVEIERIFIKTWNSPNYYACQAKLSVYVGATKYVGESTVKIKGSGQDLVAPRLASITGEGLKAVSIALKAAYIDALRDQGEDSADYIESGNASRRQKLNQSVASKVEIGE